VLSLNSRGHDVVSMTITTEGRRTVNGTALEELDEAPLDFKAGMNWLQERGFTHTGIAGHSLGAVKAIYSQARGGADAACVAAISPPRFNHDEFIEMFGERFQQVLAQARAHVDAGKPEALLRVAVPIPTIFGAAQYLKKFGPEDRYDCGRLIAETGCPTLHLYGSEEFAIGAELARAATASLKLASHHPHLEVICIEGADHGYTGRVPQALAALDGWLRTP
jgi:hypothetical protein